MGCGDDIVAVSKAVDERCFKRFVGEQWTAVDRRAHRIRRQLAGLGDAVYDLSGHRGDQIFDLFTVRGRHLGFGQSIRRRFVAAAVIEFGDDA